MPSTRPTLPQRRPKTDALTPSAWGLPEKFEKWRPNQFDAVMRGVENTKRARIQIAPVGFGKSLVYMAQTTLAPEDNGGRVAILTGTKGLQNQLMDDFSDMGLVDVRGRGNYSCSMAGPDSGLTCEDGANCNCPHRRTDRCGARRAYNAALRAPLITTNYTYWMMQYLHGEGLGAFDMLICDEGHNAPEEVASLMEVYLSEKEIGTLLRSRWPKHDAPMVEWRRWAGSLLPAAAELITYTKAQLEGRSNISHYALRQLSSVVNLERKLTTLHQSTGEWIVDPTDKGFAFNPLWGAPYTESLLFRGISSLIITSATMNTKTISLLGLDPNQCDIQQYPSNFSPDKVQIRWVPTCRVDSRMDDYGKFQLRGRLNDALRQWSDRNGLIQPTSYKGIAGSEWIYTNVPTYQSQILYPESGAYTQPSVSQFKSQAGSPPSTLMSPAIATGYDFPMLEAEYNIIPKIPFPPVQTKIMKARQEHDKEYRDHLTAIKLAQACGRTARTDHDTSQTLILDDHAEYFIPKALRSGLLAPWFKRFYDVSRTGLPRPLPKLQLTNQLSKRKS